MFRCHLITFRSQNQTLTMEKKKVIKSILFVWLIIELLLYLIDYLLYVDSIQKKIFKFSNNFLLLFASINNLLLNISIVFELQFLLIVSILSQCILLVLIPSLIIDVVPNLLTYSSLIISIILSIVFSVLFLNKSEPLLLNESYDLVDLNQFDYFITENQSQFHHQSQT